jgi:hypothetical protein
VNAATLAASPRRAADRLSVVVENRLISVSNSDPSMAFPFFFVERSGEEACDGESSTATAHASYHYTAPEKSDESWASKSA